MPKIKFAKEKKTFQVKAGDEFLNIYQRTANFPLKFGCKVGECGLCVIKILSGMENLTKKTKAESETLRKKKYDSDDRLACQCAINGSIEIESKNE